MQKIGTNRSTLLFFLKSVNLACEKISGKNLFREEELKKRKLRLLTIGTNRSAFLCQSIKSIEW